MQLQPTTRSRRVPFPKAVRVVPLEGPPRAFRLLAANLSREGMFVAAQAPFSPGTRVALSLEAGGRVLPFAQGEVIWQREGQGARPGFGVRFTDFLHPRAPALVGYLVDTLDTGKPLVAARRQAPRWSGWAAALLGAVLTGVLAMVAALAFVRGRAPALEAAAAPAAPTEVTAAAGDLPIPGASAVGPVTLRAGAPVVDEPIEGDVGAAPAPSSAPGSAKATTALGAQQPGAPALVLEPLTVGVAVQNATATGTDSERASPQALSFRGEDPREVTPPQEAAATRSASVLAHPPSTQLAAPAGLNAPKEAVAPPVAARTERIPVDAPGRAPPGGAEHPSATRVAMATGALRALTLVAGEASLTVTPVLAPKAHVLKAFVLSGPPRFVLDLSGPSPRESQTLTVVGQPRAERARVGKLPKGTRLVLDLREAATLISQPDGRYTLNF